MTQRQKKRRLCRRIAVFTGCFCISMIVTAILAVGAGAIGAVCGLLFSGVFAAVCALCCISA